MKKTKVGITTVAFSKNAVLVELIRSKGFDQVDLNPVGRRLTKPELIEFLSKYDAAIIGLDKIDRTVLSEVPNLKVISKYGVGMDNINMDDCKEFGVQVLHTPGVNKRSVSEMALGFMLGLLRNLYVTSNQLKGGDWNKSGGLQLSGRTVGVIGVGNIGKDLVSLLKPFGCKILVNDIIDQNDYYDANNVTHVSKEELYNRSDVITVHTPLTEKTQYLLNNESFSQMKKGAIIINTARGGIVNQDDLKNALKSGHLGGAAMDAYEVEPPTDSELIEIPNLYCTPHIGGNSAEAVQSMGLAAIDNLVEHISAH